jgi:hypothetical protein
MEKAEKTAAQEGTVKTENLVKTEKTATVTKDFNVATWSATFGYGVETVDVTALVQEIVNQAGWASGNALAIVCHDNGSSNDNYIGHSTYDRATDRGAKLTIEYTEGGVTVVKDIIGMGIIPFAR